jgi:hypothetical protein
MTLNDAVGILKAINEIIKGNQRVCFDEQDIEAIDTVVSHYEKSEKVDFLKSAKQPSEITHPYDLSKNRRQRYETY